MREEDLEPPLVPFDWYIDAFRELSSCRSSLAAGPIPFTAIADYCKIYDIEDFDEFLYIMRVLDNTYLRINDKKGASDGKGKSD